MNIRKNIKDSSILYIEDDATTRDQFAHFLKTQCKILHTAKNGIQGFELFKEIKPDLVITDIEMPKLNGLEMAKKIRVISLSTQIIIITAYQKPEYLLQAVNLQLTQYLIKPISLKKITEALELSSHYLDCKKSETKKHLNKQTYYDTYTKELISNNQIINLSKNERALIELLINKYPAPLSYESIEAKIYDYNGSRNAIKLLISALRNKTSKESITNISGFGYKINLMGK